MYSHRRGKEKKSGTYRTGLVMMREEEGRREGDEEFISIKLITTSYWSVACGASVASSIALPEHHHKDHQAGQSGGRGGTETPY